MLVTTGEASALTESQYHSKREHYTKMQDHAEDVFRFFKNHPKPARSKIGRNVLKRQAHRYNYSTHKLEHFNNTEYISWFTYEQLVEQGKLEVRHGGTYSYRYGDCSNRLQSISRELVHRIFGPHGTESWAVYIIDRESGFCPGAVNTTYSSWNQRAQCIAQMIPAYHTWVDYDRCKTDPAYSVKVFAELSNYGTSTGPWS